MRWSLQLMLVVGVMVSVLEVVQSLLLRKPLPVGQMNRRCTIGLVVSAILLQTSCGDSNLWPKEQFDAAQSSAMFDTDGDREISPY